MGTWNNLNGNNGGGGGSSGTLVIVLVLAACFCFCCLSVGAGWWMWTQGWFDSWFNNDDGDYVPEDDGLDDGTDTGDGTDGSDGTSAGGGDDGGGGSSGSCEDETDPAKDCENKTGKSFICPQPWSYFYRRFSKDGQSARCCNATNKAYSDTNACKDTAIKLNWLNPGFVDNMQKKIIGNDFKGKIAGPLKIGKCKAWNKDAIVFDMKPDARAEKGWQGCVGNDAGKPTETVFTFWPHCVWSDKAPAGNKGRWVASAKVDGWGSCYFPEGDQKREQMSTVWLGKKPGNTCPFDDDYKCWRSVSR